jgi:hypothetical protein
MFSLNRAGGSPAKDGACAPSTDRACLLTVEAGDAS